MREDEIWLRVVLLAIWAAGVNLWLQRHLGIGLGNPLGLLGITGGASIGSMILDRVLEAEEKKGLQNFLDKNIRRILRRYFLATPILVVLYLSGFVLAATYSSLQVVTPKEAKKLTITVSAIGAENPLWSHTESTSGKPIRKLLVTNPFGRDLRLAVHGFVTRTITLYPLIGYMVDPETDLETLPTLLFRPSFDALTSLGDGGAIKVFKVTDNECEALANMKIVKHALMLGTHRMIPSSYRTIWNLELQAKGIDGALLAKTMLAWTQPERIENERSPLEPGDRVYVVVCTKADKRKAAALITVSKDPFQDVYVHEDEGVPSRCECKEMS